MIPGNCIHHRDLVTVCAKGIDVRALVGGPDFGWRARMPCVTSSLTWLDEQVACEHRRLPSKQQLIEWEDFMDRWVSDHLAAMAPLGGAP